MIFNNVFFIFCFLPLSILLFQYLPTARLKNVSLLCMSLLFYAWNNPVSLILLLLSLVWNYCSGLQLDLETNTKKRKLIFWISVLFNLGILSIYKFAGLWFEQADTLMIPMGLSFFTFTSISYLADVYTCRTMAQKNWLSFSLYISFFGKMAMGPIVPYHEMASQLEVNPLQKENLGEGLALFTKGLIKKVLLADSFARLFTILAINQSVVGTWLYAISYMLQIYFDFSGYSDMAIGISRIFGFQIRPNFNHPYIAKNIQDFWRRWHISLSQWFRDYVYIPLGGNRQGTKKYIRNILIVWLCTGIWHGTNWTFIVWGFYYAFFLLLEHFWLKKYLDKCPRILQHLYTLMVVLIGWVFFMSPDLASASQTLMRMFGVQAQGFVNQEALYILTSHLILFLLGILFSSTIYDRIRIYLFNSFKNSMIDLSVLVYSICFIVCIAFLIGSTYQSFLYGAF